jgi:hypothetical protein
MIEKERINFDSTVKREDIVIDEFLLIPEVPMQRDTETRAYTKKTRKMLEKLLSVHLEVSLIELIKDCTFYGKKYKKGSRFIVNGNTRRFYWLNGMSDKIPEKVYSKIYLVQDMEEAKAIYNTYDSPDATEKTQEKFYGILSGVYGYQPVSTKVTKGVILTALGYACKLLNNQKFVDVESRPKAEVLPIIIGEYIEEIKMFDRLVQKDGQWDSALTCAALMILKKYGNHPRAIEFLQRIESRKKNTEQAERDGATHVSEEWDSKKPRFQNRRAAKSGHGGLQETVPFVLYWAEKFIADKKQRNTGGGWDKMHITWFDDYKSRNNALSKALNISPTPELEDIIA